MAVSQSMVLTMLLQMAARFTADFLGQMTAVERVLEYTRLPTEDNMEFGRKYITEIIFLQVFVTLYSYLTNSPVCKVTNNYYR